MTNIGPRGDIDRLASCPTAGGGLTRVAYTRALEEGVEIRPLLKKAGLTIQQIENSALRINVQSQIMFLDLVATALNDECLGFRLAQTFDLREIGMLYYVLASSDTLGDALQRASRYSTTINEGMHLRYVDRPGSAIAFEHIGVARHSDRHQVEFFVTTMVRICRHLAGRNLLPDHVRLRHQRSPSVPQFGAFFGCDVEFGSAIDEVAFPTAIQRLPLASSDPFLNALLVDYCEQALANRTSRPVALRSSVENEIVPLLPHGKARVVEVAHRLGMSQRTLARRLACDGLSFVLVLDELRSDLAKRYLRELNLPISTIAWLLGYRQVSALTHAVRRWTGKTPKEVRFESRLKSP